MSRDMIELGTMLRYRMGATTSGVHQDASDYVTEVRVDIFGESYSDPEVGGDDGIHLGILEFTRIRISLACDDGADLLEIFDESQEIHDLTSALYEDEFLDYAGPVRDRFSEGSGQDDLLHIRKMVVFPFARGQRVGFSALHRVVRDWEVGCGLVTIEPFPLQCRNGIREEGEWEALALGEFPADRRVATERLVNHYRGLGFQQLEGIPWLARSPYLRQIPVQELDVRDTVVVPRSVAESMDHDAE